MARPTAGGRAWRIGLRLLRQDYKSGELHLLTAALVLTVAAITAVGFFTDRIEGAMERQGGELIAADLALDGSGAIPERHEAEAHALGLATARTLEFPSVVMAGDRPHLVQVKAVDPSYPLRGALRVRADLTAPEETAAGGPPPGELWVEPRLVHLLGVAVGDAVQLGEASFRVGAVIAYEPDRGGNLFQLAPRVMINTADIPATGLVTPASRVRHRLLVAGELPAVERFKRFVTAEPIPNAGLIDAREARPEFSNAVERASRFLHLATLVTLLVAGAAIALATRRLVERQTDAVAVMRCLGAHRHLLTRIFVLRLVLIGLGASLAGSLLGYIAQAGLAAMLADWFGPELPPPSLRPLAVGVGTGLITLVGFGLPPLLQLAKVSPLRALRRDLGTPRAPAAAAFAAAAAALALLVFWQAGDPELAWKLLAGVAGLLIALVVTVLLLIRLIGGLAGRARGIWRLGLAALTRRPAGALLSITGFGLGILALLLLAVVRLDLLRTWQESLPEGAPNHFLINIQPDEVEPLRSFLEDRGLATTGLYPMIRGRLTAIGDRPVDPDAYANPRAQRLAAREFNLSFADEPQPDNRIIAGDWWGDPQGPPQFSVEAGLAETLGIQLGDTLTFSVSGREIQAPVTSLREVQWDSFNVNFFVIASPSLLGSELATYVTSFHAPGEAADRIAELVRAFPSVTLFDVGALMDQVRRIMDRGVMAVEYVFLFTLAAGILVMYAGIQASLEERRAEHGVLRALGARRAQLLRSLAVEFTAAGLLAGVLAALFAQITGLVLARQVFGLELDFSPGLWLTGVFGSALLLGVAGTLATYPLLVRPPLKALHGRG
ncbi:MAG: FtsX-like permease family protein [Chromatiaceae bacterium]|jgi:putative ABC transport system permease protein|nr:FtsX-like permease family protein [Chromatiaceae bacterium]